MLVRIAAGLAVLTTAAAARADTLEVGTGQTYATIADAATAAHDGDTVEIHAGTYHEAVQWTASGLTVRGVGGRPVIDMTGMTIDNGKAIFVSSGADETFENLEFVGAAVTDQNGAGIRWEGAGMLTVRDSVFRSNENGILGGGALHPENVALVENNEFVDNGRGRVGYTHSVYFGDADTVTFRGNWSHALWPDGADIGHLFKCRAHHSYVLYNRLTAEATWSSYEINLPQGGEAYVIGNLIQQRVGDQRIMISFADGDGDPQYADSKLFVVGNTFVNESSGPATFIRTTMDGAQITAIDNLLVGDGTLVSGGTVAAMMNNVTTATPGFVDQASYDYHLMAGSPAIDAGVDPGGALAPTSQYVHPTAIESRAPVGAIDVGAYEFGNVGAPGGGDGDTTGPGGTDGGTTTPGNGGGCCSTGGGNGATSMALGLALVVVGRRRRR